MSIEWVTINGIARPVEVYSVALPECERCGMAMSRGPLDAAEVAEREPIARAAGACVCRVSRMGGGWFVCD